MKIGELIRTWRGAHSLSTRQLAEQMSVSPSALLRLENGTVPDGTTMIRLAHWLFDLPEKGDTDGRPVHAQTQSDK